MPPTDQLLGRTARGALAGVGGALALAPTDVLLRYLLCRSPVFDLSLVTRRLAARALGRSPTRRFVSRVEWLLRFGSGASLGALVSAARLQTALGAGLLTGFEMMAMPAVGATPPIRAWSRREQWLLLGHAAVFMLVTRALLRLGRTAS